MDLIHEAYRPENFEKAAKVLTEEIAKYLKSAPGSRVLSHLDPPARVEKARKLLEAASGFNEESLRHLVSEILSQSAHLHSPAYMGHQLNAPIPLAALFSWLGTTLNPGHAVYELSQFMTAAERVLISKAGQAVGWKSGFEGIITNGGSLANVTAILAARNWKFRDAWKKGLQGRRPAILTSGDSHYRIARAAGALGIGVDHVIAVPLDERRRMDPAQLEATYERARNAGLEVFCIVGSACSTSVGAFDPLDAIGDFARQHGLWFHVDAAHGGSFLLSRRHRELLRGIEKADSVIWDAHKMMMVPSLCTFVLYREAARSYLPFHQEAPYLFDNAAEDMRNYDSGLRTFECTKNAVALPTFAMWALFGTELFEQLMDRTIEVTREFYDLIRESADFKALHDPECNIFCFRYLPAGMATASPAEISEFQKSLRERLVREGDFYITGTSLGGVYVLRVTIINPFTSREHIVALLDRIRKLGAQGK